MWHRVWHTHRLVAVRHIHSVDVIAEVGLEGNLLSAQRLDRSDDLQEDHKKQHLFDTLEVNSFVQTNQKFSLRIAKLF